MNSFQVAMNMATPFSVVTQDASLAHSELLARRLTGAIPVLSEEIIHELRQPLGVIDSLAYYLELTAEDETARAVHEVYAAFASRSTRGELHELHELNGISHGQLMSSATSIDQLAARIVMFARNVDHARQPSVPARLRASDHP